MNDLANIYNDKLAGLVSINDGNLQINSEILKPKQEIKEVKKDNTIKIIIISAIGVIVVLIIFKKLF